MTITRTRHVHTIPVDSSLTVEEAWQEICRYGYRVTDTGSERWANVHCDDGDCHLAAPPGR